MTISAKVICDSISPDDIRLTTLQLRYPRFIHAEFMTHRAFSRNASSSRAVPVEKLIQDVIDDPVYPSFWGKNQPGMQARGELDETAMSNAIRLWEDQRQDACNTAQWMHEHGAHKQIVNRLLEPFSHINVVVSATDWANFFALRRHPDAQPEMKLLADAIYEARAASQPTRLYAGRWHLPYVLVEDAHSLDWSDDRTIGNAIKCSVARCARTSYLTHDQKPPDIEADLALYARLVGAEPLHASPAEHQATPDHHGKWHDRWQHPTQHGNFRGWIQYRKTLFNECVHDD